jgi:hypothetical protein
MALRSTVLAGIAEATVTASAIIIVIDWNNRYATGKKSSMLDTDDKTNVARCPASLYLPGLNNN